MAILKKKITVEFVFFVLFFPNLKHIFTEDDFRKIMTNRGGWRERERERERERDRESKENSYFQHILRDDDYVDNKS